MPRLMAIGETTRAEWDAIEAAVKDRLWKDAE